MRTLASRATLNMVKFLGVLAFVLFVSARTLRFWQAWLYLGLNFAWLAATGAYFQRRDPALVERRLVQDEQGEKEQSQRRIISVMRLLGVVTLVVAGVDRRLGLSAVPLGMVATAAVVFVIGNAVIFVVFRENTYTSSIVEVDPRQTVVTTGPYRLLRHPFYAGTLLMGVATPFILGSYWAALLVPLGWALLVGRVLAEERFLAERLPGYTDYMGRTRTRLIPGVW